MSGSGFRYHPKTILIDIGKVEFTSVLKPVNLMFVLELSSFSVTGEVYWHLYRG